MIVFLVPSLRSKPSVCCLSCSYYCAAGRLCNCFRLKTAMARPHHVLARSTSYTRWIGFTERLRPGRTRCREKAILQPEPQVRYSLFDDGSILWEAAALATRSCVVSGMLGMIAFPPARLRVTSVDAFAVGGFSFHV